MIIHTDASCGDLEVGVGYTIQVDGEVYKGSTSFKGKFTSMEAEFLALKEAACVAAYHFDTKQHVFFYTDCQGLVEKMEEPNGDEKWNEKRSLLLSILKTIGNWSIKWVPRERNRDADALANFARETVA